MHVTNQHQDLLMLSLVLQKIFTQSKFRMIHALCSATNLRGRAEKIKKPSVQANSQGHVSHYHELGSRV